MCVTNIYVDRYPNGREVEFRQTTLCQYGVPGRPCQSLTTLENPVRKIQYGELSTEYILTQPAFTQTPPRSPGGSNHRYSGGDTGSEDGQRRRRSRRMSFAVDVGLGKKLPTKQHRKERIVIVDSPPTPQTPPQNFRQTFTAPSSPNPSPFIIDSSPRGPIIVDERPLRNRNRSSSSNNVNSNNATTTGTSAATNGTSAPRPSSVEAVIGERFPLRRSRSRPDFESPSSSHTSFDSRARREAEEEEQRRERQRQERQEEEEEAARRRAERIAAQDEEIRRRPAIPIPPKPLRQREFLRPVVSQSTVLSNNVVDDRRLQERLEAAAAERRRLEEKEKEKEKEERERLIRLGREAEQEEAQRRRLRERQLPGRRFSVGPGHRRHRILYDDGVYRWE
ncbi:hypothetical protein F5884DRAFT_452751 [Xylogone sp. PMI_703]|nr:hypothetical protein F5884DRAFT_452751 [Xylogone sp. PMI_703]